MGSEELLQRAGLSFLLAKLSTCRLKTRPCVRGGGMNFDELHESLTDFFSRMHHDVETARVRAASVVEIVKAHLDVEPALEVAE